MSQITYLPYTIYLMRLWLDSEGETAWRFSLEDPHTGARRGFATLDELIIFLQQEITKDTRKNHDA
ncbi:MAG: hypothetical protein KBE23_14020 [Chloroflexi bacterium]|nr:hypothetical protein [Chloroflexota bacterium]MBP7043857.1 hypothetical protein [Chloroflexota bacterium]